MHSRAIFLLAALSLAHCAPVLRARGLPPQALRKEAPAAVADALAVGATAPQLQLALTDGSRTGPNDRATVLVFYRGHW